MPLSHQGSLKALTGVSVRLPVNRQGAKAQEGEGICPASDSDGGRASVSTDLRASAHTCTCTWLRRVGRSTGGWGVSVPKHPARLGTSSGLSKCGRKRERSVVPGRPVAYASRGHQLPAKEVPSLSKPPSAGYLEKSHSLLLTASHTARQQDMMVVKKKKPPGLPSSGKLTRQSKIKQKSVVRKSGR